MTPIQLNPPADLRQFIQQQAKKADQDEVEYLMNLIKTDQAFSQLENWPKYLDERLDKIESGEGSFSAWSEVKKRLKSHL